MHVDAFYSGFVQTSFPCCFLIHLNLTIFLSPILLQTSPARNGKLDGKGGRKLGRTLGILKDRVVWGWKKQIGSVAIPEQQELAQSQEQFDPNLTYPSRSHSKATTFRT